LSKIILGDWFDGGQAKMDLARLLASRLLLQAGSGFGKSWALRRMLEQCAGAVQQFILDPEGEFATLREKHDYVIAAVNGGDALAHPRTAGLLLRRLMETGVSAILDISELKKPERRRFARLFVEEMMGLPRAMWSPVLVVVDEAHEFAPEKDEAESLGAIVDLATRGRKRGFALVAATQRIGKLSKDVAAELHNKLIGFTSLDIDVKRAAFELGLTPKDANEQLRMLKPGDFYAFGPATSQAIQRLHIGTVATTHPEPGAKKFRAPPSPTEAIKAVLPKLADLPKEAEEELRTADDLRRELAKARRELTLAQRQQQPTVAPPKVDQAAAKRDAATIKRLHGAIEALMKFVINVNTAGFAKDAGVEPEALQRAISSAVDQAMKLVDAKLAGRAQALQKLQSDGGKLIASVQKLLADQEVQINIAVKHNEPFTVAPVRDSSRVKTPVKTGAKSHANGAGEHLPPGETAVLRACIQFPEGLRREQLTVLTGYKRSSRDAYIQRLRERAYIETSGDKVTVTDPGRNAMPDAEPLPTGEDLQQYWLDKLPEGERKILAILIERYPEPVPRADLDELTGYQRSSRDAYLQRMRAKQLFTEPSRGAVRASEDLF
jgi:hypothetical protein